MTCSGPARRSLALGAPLALAVALAAPARADQPAGASVPAADPPAATAAAGAPAAAGADPLAAHPALRGDARAAMRRACIDRAPACDPVSLLGEFERQALARALASRKLTLDPAPVGKRVGQVRVATLPVFGDEVPFLRWANVFHIRSRPEVLARELVLGPGDRWDLDLIDESLRNLRNPLQTSVVVIVAVRPASGAADEVDLLIVTRDVWSLRTNYNGELQDGTFTFLTISLSENNFLGRRKLAAASFRMDQATFTVGPVYVDSNAFGRHIDIRGSGGPIWNRASRELEGSTSTVSVSRPLWSLASTWGVYGEWSHDDRIVRRFRGNDLRTYDAPSTPADDRLPWTYRDRQWSAGASVVRQLGDCPKHRLKLGYELSSERPALLPGTTGDPAALADFVADVLPRSERSGRLYAGYELYTPNYREYRDIDSYDVAESVRLGPRLAVTVGVAAPLLGSDRAFGTAAVEESLTVPLGADGVLTTAGGVGVRLDGGAVIDRSVTQSVRLVTPRVAWLRLVSEAKVTGFFREQANRRVFVGGDNGLRGFPVGAFAGQRALLWQSELRTGSVRMPFGLRWGFLAFYELAGAGDTVGEVGLHHDVGLGLRSLTPQLSAEVFRVDLGMALDGPDRGTPRLILGYRQAF